MSKTTCENHDKTSTTQGDIRIYKRRKNLAKLMFYYSASEYSRMRKVGLNLPSESSIRNWISETEI